MLNANKTKFLIIGTLSLWKN